MTNNHPTPWKLIQGETWPWDLTILDSNNKKVLSEGLYSYSTADKNKEEANAREGNALAFEKLQLIIAAVNLYSKLIS